jgi:hypothetical protein
MTDTPFSDLLDDIECFLASTGPVADPVGLAEARLTGAEGVLEVWLLAKGQVPTDERVEGYRLLALHRQGARGDASFNACRETCREVVYLRNVVALYDDDPAQARHHLNLQAMVLRHLALFVGGKLQEAGLGDFCCSSRPVRTTSLPADQINPTPARATGT